MFKKLKTAAIAMTAALSASAATAEVNLTAQTAGAGTPVGLTATALVEYASERGIANIQLKDIDYFRSCSAKNAEQLIFYT